MSIRGEDTLADVTDGHVGPVYLYVIHVHIAYIDSIYFSSYTFDDLDIVRLLRDQHAQGVDVLGAVDRRQFVMGPSVQAPLAMQQLISDGIPVLMQSPQSDSEYAAMHSKVWVVDAKCVIIGSSNVTTHSMSKNCEMVSVIESAAVGHFVRNHLLDQFHDFDDASSHWPWLVCLFPKGQKPQLCIYLFTRVVRTICT